MKLPGLFVMAHDVSNTVLPFGEAMSLDELWPGRGVFAPRLRVIEADMIFKDCKAASWEVTMIAKIMLFDHPGKIGFFMRTLCP